MSRSKKLGYIAVVALGFAVGTAASVRAADKVTLTFANWAAAEGTTRPAIEKVIAAFEKAHPDITIRSEAISF